MDGQPPDVEGLGVLIRAIDVARAAGAAGAAGAADQAVDAAEGEGLVANIELLESRQACPDDDVAFRPGLEGATPAQVEHALEHRVGVASHGIEARIGEVHEVLLCLQLRLHVPTSTLVITLAVTLVITLAVTLVITLAVDLAHPRVARPISATGGSGEPSIVCAPAHVRTGARSRPGPVPVAARGRCPCS